MRKGMLWVLALVLCLFCAVAAADTQYTLDKISATLSLADTYIVLTPTNLGQHTEFLEKIGKTREVLEADFADRGVALQAWVSTLDACLEITVTQDEDSKAYFDIDAQTNQARTTWRTSILKGQQYKDAGYEIKSADWKRQTNGGRFLMIKYKRTVDGRVYWGYARRTIRNGYTLNLDYQVYDRGLKDKDLNAVNKVANTVTFTNLQGIPATAEGVITFTAVPPTETNTGTFTVEGTCTPGAHLIGVVMRMSSPTPTRFEATAKKTGAFKMNVTLPEEGVWLMTLTIEVNGSDTVRVFDPTTYSKTTIPVSLDSPIPEQLTGDQLVISGKTTSAVTIQCIVTHGGTTYDKTVRTNNSGKFSFKVPTSDEADYDITLVFSKKNFSTRRFTYTAHRELTEEDIRNGYRASAVKPAYSTLKAKLTAYTGRVMVYTVYITDVQQVGDEWIVYGAMTQTKKGYNNIIVITCPEDPGFTLGTQHKMYATCVGSYQVQGEEGSTSYPCFDLLFWEN